MAPVGRIASRPRPVLIYGHDLPPPTCWRPRHRPRPSRRAWRALAPEDTERPCDPSGPPSPLPPDGHALATVDGQASAGERPRRGGLYLPARVTYRHETTRGPCSPPRNLLGPGTAPAPSGSTAGNGLAVYHQTPPSWRSGSHQRRACPARPLATTVTTGTCCGRKPAADSGHE